MNRTIGLWRATGVGIGAIVGGGVLVLAGVAFQTAGPGSMLAFGLNGLIAIITAMSFAEMAVAFPQSGGAYVFARRVLSIRVAFAVGWVLWFAYIVAGVLYALGFASYALLAAQNLWPGGRGPEWLQGRPAALGLAILATLFYTLMLIRKNTGGGQWATWGKVVVFAVLILVGFIALTGQPADTVASRMSPFLPHGFPGLLQAMGFTFIALQGFDLIAAIAGEEKDPERNIPRSMFLSLGASLLIYIPLSFISATVGVGEGQSIVTMSADHPETVMANAAEHFMGPRGYWLVIVAAILATLSALQANVMAASRVALSMARDRTLPRSLSSLNSMTGTPDVALWATAGAFIAVLFLLPGVEEAGAAASLIFLTSFTLAHITAWLARSRQSDPQPFQTPLFPLVPLVGGIACALLGLFQALMVPSAGAIVAIWLGIGAVLYLAHFSGRAEAVDAFQEAYDPQLARLRGNTELVLVPIANPDHAPALVDLGHSLAPPYVGKVLLMSVMKPPDVVVKDVPPTGLVAGQEVLRSALLAAMGSGFTPESLLTVAHDPWTEIARVAQTHRCGILLLGLSNMETPEACEQLELLLNKVRCDVVILRAPAGWSLGQARRVLVPLGGRSQQDGLRARLLGSLIRHATRDVRFVRVLKPESSQAEMDAARTELTYLSQEEAPDAGVAEVLSAKNTIETLAAECETNDVVILGTSRKDNRRVLGELNTELAKSIGSALILISRR